MSEKGLFSDTIDVCKAHGGVRPSFEDHETWFKVILAKVDVNLPQKASHASGDVSAEPLQKTLQKTPQKTPQKILASIRANPFVGTQEIADAIGVERSTVARAIAKLKSEGMLRRVGPDKGGHWEIVEKKSMESNMGRSYASAQYIVAILRTDIAISKQGCNSDPQTRYSTAYAIDAERCLKWVS